MVTTTNPALQASWWLFISSPGVAKTSAVKALRKVSLGLVGFKFDSKAGGGFKGKYILWPLAAKDVRVTRNFQLTVR